MDIFDNISIIVSGSHLQMLNTLLIIAQFLFTLFTGIMLGSLILSTRLKSQSQKDGTENPDFKERMSLEMMGLITSSPSTWFGFGLIPFLAIIVIYIQLTAGSGSSAGAVLLVGFLFYAFGLLLAYFYKNSNRFIQFYNFVNSDENDSNLPKDDYRSSSAEDYFHQMESQKSNTGFWAVVMMLIGSWAFISGTHLASDSSLFSQSAMNNFFTLPVFYKMINLIALSFTVAAATYSYLKFHWDGGFDFKDESYKRWARNKSAKITVISMAVQIIFYGLSLALVPDLATSYLVYAWAAVAIVLAFVATNLFYTIIKTDNSSHVRIAYPLIIAMFLFMVVSSQTSFEVSNSDNIARIANDYDLQMASLHSSGEEIQEADGAEIYQTRCAACHKFDLKQVTAPSYKDILGKYNNDTQALVDFILNPTPQDTENYPSGMANPALKGSEARAVAKYIQEEVKKY
jgi:cytochrome c